MTSSRLFVGRENELAAFRAALDGDTRLLVVVGDAGVGKTRFVTECLRLAGAGRAWSAWGACLPLAEKLPFLPVAEALDALKQAGWRSGTGACAERSPAASPAMAETARVPHYGPAPSVSPAQVVPPQLHTVVIGGMPGWQIALIAAGAAVLAAVLAVTADRARATRRHATAL